MPKKHHNKFNGYIIAIVMIIIVLVILIAPIIRQNRIYVIFGPQENGGTERIESVYAQTVYVPLISLLLQPQSTIEGSGVYTLIVKVDSVTMYKNNVIVGAFIFVINNGFEGNYTVDVTLEKNGLVIDNFQKVITL